MIKEYKGYTVHLLAMGDFQTAWFIKNKPSMNRALVKHVGPHPSFEDCVELIDYTLTQ